MENIVSDQTDERNQINATRTVEEYNQGLRTWMDVSNARGAIPIANRAPITAQFCSEPTQSPFEELYMPYFKERRLKQMQYSDDTQRYFQRLADDNVVIYPSSRGQWEHLMDIIFDLGFVADKTQEFLYKAYAQNQAFRIYNKRFNYSGMDYYKDDGYVIYSGDQVLEAINAPQMPKPIMNLSYLKANQISVWCTTEKEAIQFMQMCINEGINWATTKDANTRTNWAVYEEKTAYQIDTGNLKYANQKWDMDLHHKHVYFQELLGVQPSYDPSKSKLSIAELNLKLDAEYSAFIALRWGKQEPDYAKIKIVGIKQDNSDFAFMVMDEAENIFEYSATNVFQIVEETTPVTPVTPEPNLDFLPPDLDFAPVPTPKTASKRRIKP